MLVNCENSRTLRPSATSSGSISISASSLARGGAAFAPRQLDQARVAADLAQLQQRIEDHDVAAVEPLGGDRLAHFRVHRASRSRRGRAGAPRARSVHDDSVLGGSSGATSLLGAAQDERPHAAGAGLRPARLVAFSIGVRNARAKCSSGSPSRPGIRKSNSDHSSPRWFSIGVPVSTAVAGLERRGPLRELVSRVLDGLRLVEDHRVPRLGEQDVLVAQEQRVGGEHQVVRRGCRRNAVPAPARAGRAPERRAKRSAPSRQLATTLVGQTTRHGRSGRPSCSARRWASACTVLPRPMSSASTPPRPASPRNRSQEYPWP